MSGSHLDGANLRKAYLGDIDARGSSWQLAVVDEACFERVNLSEADLQGLVAGDWQLTHSVLDHASLRGAKLNKGFWLDSSLAGCELNSAIVRELTCMNIDAPGAAFCDTKLHLFKLLECKLVQCDFTGAELEQVVFRKCDLARPAHEA